MCYDFYMALGRYHDTFNLAFGAVISGAMIGFGVETLITVAFSTGWLFSTLIFGPDSDLTVKRRTQILRYFLWPYSLFFRHRGISHHFFWGTVSRNLYLLILLIGIMKLILYLSTFFQLEVSVMDGLNHLMPPVKFWFSKEGIYLWKFGFFLFLGQWLSDLSHLFLDKIADKTGFFYK